MSIRILIADDQELVRTGIRMILESEPDLEIVGEARDGADAIAKTRRLQPDIVLMDIRMPDVDGVTATREIRDVEPSLTTRILVLTTYDLDEYVFDALRAGASGFLLKHTPAETLIAGIRTVAGGEALLAPEVTQRVIEAFGDVPAGPREPPAELATLTEREREVFDLLIRGRTNAEIAAALFVEPSTVKTHAGHALAKLGLRDRTAAVIYAYERGLVTPGAGP